MTSAGLALSIRVLKRHAPGLTKDHKFLLQVQLHSKLAFPTDRFDGSSRTSFYYNDTWHSLPVSLHSFWDHFLGACESPEIVRAVLRCLQAFSASLLLISQGKKVAQNRTQSLTMFWVNALTGWHPHLTPTLFSLRLSFARPHFAQPSSA